MRIRSALPFVCSLWLAACGGGSGPPDGAATDAHADLGAAACTTDHDCDDGMFCTGHEACHPGTAGADARGCVVTPACAPTQTCNPTTSTCTTDCSVAADADGDGHRALSCGGDDCDDADANRYPGNHEVCDLAGHDEDCNPSTLAGPEGDTDGDGFVATTCCYLAPGGALHCGDDCDDMSFGVHVGAIEVCNGVDDNCNGLLDGPSEDTDRDGFANDACAGAGGMDCDDAAAYVHVGATELCDGIDDDCMIAGVRSHVPGLEPGEDLDGDHHAPTAATCSGTGPAGVTVFPADDCDDTRAFVHGGARELCNAVDDDCDGTVDDRAGGAAGTACVAPHVGVGGAHTCLIEDDGTLDCFGGNACGQLGDQSAPPGLVVHVALPSPVVQVEGGDQFTCARSMDGSVSCWGIDGLLFARDPLHNVERCGGSGVVGLGGPATDLSAGTNYACAVVGGAVKCWGNSMFYQLDPGTMGDPSYWLLPVTAAGLTDATRVDAGLYLTCAVHGTGAVKCWGANFETEFGPSGTHAADIAITDATDVAVGAYFACALRVGGTVACWGTNHAGDLGCAGTAGCPPVGGPPASTTRTPVAVTGLSNVVALESGGGGHVCARTMTGEVWCWGLNDDDQLGDESYTSGSGPAGTDSGVPVRANRVDGATEVAVGVHHTCVVAAAHVRCFGLGSSKQLGDGQSAHTDPWDRYEPEISVVAHPVGMSLSAGATCFVTTRGEVRCAGDNPFGEIGSAGLGFPTFPINAFRDTDELAVGIRDNQSVHAHASGLVSVGGRYSGGDRTLPGATTASAGSRHFCALVAGGDLRCWGYDNDGEVGDGTASATTVTTPAHVAISAPVLEGVTGGFFSCARTATETYCWGRGDVGQLGSLPLGGSAMPRLVTLASRAVDLDAGDDSACAALASGGVACWGAALGPFAASNTPAAVSGVTNAVQVAVGGTSACARTGDGHVFCWGDGANGRLGNGATTGSAGAVAVTYVADAVDVACGGSHCCATRACGQAVCWGQGGRWLPTAGDGVVGDQATPIGVAGMYTF